MELAWHAIFLPFLKGIFCLQETKVSSKGLLMIPNFVIFEVLRKEREGGGLMTGIHDNLNPVLIFEDEESEILVVQINVNHISIRIINCYGPQEYSNIEKIITFYATLDQIIQNARIDGCYVLLQMDANAKVGPDVIKGDPHPQSSNGQYLVDLIERNNLIICNSTEKCQGLITRRRMTKTNAEESIIDYLIVCEQLFPYLENMQINPAYNPISTLKTFVQALFLQSWVIAPPNLQLN